MIDGGKQRDELHVAAHAFGRHRSAGDDAVDKVHISLIAAFRGEREARILRFQARKHIPEPLHSCGGVSPRMMVCGIVTRCVTRTADHVQILAVEPALPKASYKNGHLILKLRRLPAHVTEADDS